jgi:DNA-binding SARP family transcriptional activator
VLTVELLGPLRVSVAGRAVELPAGRLRALLALLAMSAGQLVLTDKLATAVWGTDPPGDARANVRTNVKRLRRALGAAEQLIVARPGGYLLALEPDQVDALRFGRLLDDAAAGPDPAAERSLLNAALALWRDTPFDGIRSDWLEQSVAPALHERYLTALERRIDLDLESRAHPVPGRAWSAGRTGRAESAAGIPLGAAASRPGIGRSPS